MLQNNWNCSKMESRVEIVVLKSTSQELQSRDQKATVFVTNVSWYLRSRGLGTGMPSRAVSTASWFSDVQDVTCWHEQQRKGASVHSRLFGPLKWIQWLKPKLDAVWEIGECGILFLFWYLFPSSEGRTRVKQKGTQGMKFTEVLTLRARQVQVFTS